ncbi:hypothetical protein Nepgr_003934 [Nepenthes gracilis]|uniref:Uncharacterized protein n=1 Tax=Nepenthes gracilis TaxID=150966 RepID=A0AAD3S0F7_NEPGR|nr:hypothetical protein Nepgr_003934 [Nepenthes gracilis]
MPANRDCPPYLPNPHSCQETQPNKPGKEEAKLPDAIFFFWGDSILGKCNSTPFLSNTPLSKPAILAIANRYNRGGRSKMAGKLATSFYIFAGKVLRAGLGLVLRKADAAVLCTMFTIYTALLACPYSLRMLMLERCNISCDIVSSLVEGWCRCYKYWMGGRIHSAVYRLSGGVVLPALIPALGEFLSERLWVSVSRPRPED